MHDIDLIISGGKALLLDEANTCLDKWAESVSEKGLDELDDMYLSHCMK